MRNSISSVVLIVACSCWGCGGGGSGGGGPAGFAEVRQQVVAALDAWKAGRPADPKLVDQDAKSGLKLFFYEIGDPPAGWTPATGLGVTLSLKDAKGRKIVRHAVYRVKETPERIVNREE